MFSRISPIYKDLALLTIIFGLMYWGLSDIRPLADPDEGRYVEIPREMLVSGDWITPRLNGVLYFEKPPAFYWLQAIALKFGGVQEWVGRFWNCTFGVLGILATYGIGYRLHGRRAAIVAAYLLGTCPLFFVLTHIITLDAMVSFWLAMALYAFILGRRVHIGMQRRLWFMAFYTALAVATLTKGLMALLFPGAILLLWLALTGLWRELKTYYIPSGIVLYLLITVPWHWMAAQRTPEFAWFYLVHEQFLRYLQPLHGRGKPWWFLPSIFLAATLPWSAFFVGAMREQLRHGWRILRQRSEMLLLMLWCSFFVIFFAFSKSQLVPYVMPALYPFALITSTYIVRTFEGRWPNIQRTYYALAALFGILALVHPLALIRYAEELSTLWLWSGIIVTTGAIGSLGVIYWARKERYQAAFKTLMVLICVLLACVNPIGKDQRLSTKSIALYLKPRLQPGDTVYQLRGYYQDFPAYLERLTHVFASPDEQEFGLSLEDLSDRYPSEAVMKERWNNPQGRIYGLIRKTKLKAFEDLVGPQTVGILIQNRDFVLITPIHP